jgi:hypothetical protein
MKQFSRLAAVDVENRQFPEPNVVLVERTPDAARPSFRPGRPRIHPAFAGKGLITKQEARALSLAKLRLKPDAIVWDIGAGSGSVGLECARLARTATSGRSRKTRAMRPTRGPTRPVSASAITRCAKARRRPSSTPGRTRTPYSSAVRAANWPS